MSYLFHRSKGFTLIDATSKNGVFCQFFSPHPSKPLPITPAGTKAYTCCLNLEGQLHVATMPDSSHLNLHILESNNRFTRYNLISNPNSNYELSSPLLYRLGSEVFITYISHPIHTETYHFIQEKLDSPNLVTLYTLDMPPTQIKSIQCSNSEVIIFFIVEDHYDHLYALHITPGKPLLTEYLSSPYPIVDYSICLHDGVLHIVYTTELHGKYELFYFNPAAQSITPIMTTVAPCNPVIFYYYHALWINLTFSQHLQTLLSVDEGKSFSVPVNATLQNNLRLCQFYTTDSAHLSASELYISISSTSLKLCTIAMIDAYHFHSDTAINPEVELLLEGLYLLTQANVPSLAPNPEPSISKTPLHTSPSPNPASPPPSRTNLETAKKAFMNEQLDGWNLPPRI